MSCWFNLAAQLNNQWTMISCNTLSHTSSSVISTQLLPKAVLRTVCSRNHCSSDPVQVQSSFAQVSTISWMICSCCNDLFLFHISMSKALLFANCLVFNLLILHGFAPSGSVLCQCNKTDDLGKPRHNHPLKKNQVTCKSPVGDISVVTLIRTDTTFDHSQKAEKVCYCESSTALSGANASFQSLFSI